jgi:hypothetical protein
MNNNENDSTISNDDDKFTLLSLKNLELKQLKKLYDILSIKQKKDFITAFVNIFDQKSLQKLNFSLESLRHNDFEFKYNKFTPNLSLLGQSNSFKHLKQYSNHGTKLSIVSGNLKHDFKAHFNSHEASASSFSLKSTSHPRIESSKSDFNNLKHSSLNNYHQNQNRFSIDKFIKKKNRKLIDQKWNLKEIATLTRTKSKSNLMPRKSLNFNLLKTGNLIDKIKIFFHENYSSSLEFYELDSEKTYENFKSEQRESVKRNSSGKMNQNSDSAKNMPKTSSYYLKKLNNNYYDRKLWNSLNSSRDFSYANDYFLREYDTDFSILLINKNDVNSDLKNLRKIPLPSIKQHVPNNGIDIEKLTKFQEEILRKACLDRNSNLDKILKYIPVSYFSSFSSAMDFFFMIFCFQLRNWKIFQSLES